MYRPNQCGWSEPEPAPHRQMAQHCGLWDLSDLAASDKWPHRTLTVVLVPVCIPLQNVAALKQLMEEVATLKAEREVVMKELKDPITDISELAGGTGLAGGVFEGDDY